MLLQGPCQRGKLFYLDPDQGGSGCHCRQDWEAYYWAPLDQCFEQESPGPCREGQYFAYNATSRQTECSCFKVMPSLHKPSNPGLLFRVSATLRLDVAEPRVLPGQ